MAEPKVVAYWTVTELLDGLLSFAVMVAAAPSVTPYSIWVKPKPSLGAPLPISLRCIPAKGILISRQPLKLSGTSTDQRSASSLVEPELRLSSTSTNRVVPLFLPYNQKEIPS